MPGGRPSKYDPAMCARVVELMAEGASKTEVAADLGITCETMRIWTRDNPEFSASVKQGEDLSAAWWEREGRKSLRDKDFNATLWYMNMKNRHGWRDKSDTVVTGADGGPVQHCISVAFVEPENAG